jgi:hypothetical protein
MMAHCRQISPAGSQGCGGGLMLRHPIPAAICTALIELEGAGCLLLI